MLLTWYLNESFENYSMSRDLTLMKDIDSVLQDIVIGFFGNSHLTDYTNRQNN